MSWFARPRLQVMEDRLAPAVLSVVNPVLANGTSTFATINAAQLAFTSGDIIQVEPGSSPGGISLSNLAGQTIRGNPAFAADTLPVVPVELSAALSQTNVTLRNLNLALGDSLTITGAGWTIEGCAVTNTFAVSAIEGLIDLESTGTTLRNNRFNAIRGAAGGNVVGVTPPAGGSGNLITDNTFFALSDLNLIEYEAVALRTVTDQVVSNTFLGQGSASLTQAHVQVVDNCNIAGLTISNNSFTDNSNGSQRAISIGTPSASGTSVTISNNRISLPDAVPPASNTGIFLNSEFGLPRTFRLLHNDIATNGTSIAVWINVRGGASDLVGKVEGNDLRHNRIGIFFTGSGTGTFASGIDLGGGGQGSLGLNNFRGYTVADIFNGAVNVGSGFSNAQTISARNNIWSVPNPETVIRDNADSASVSVNVDSASPLTANQSAVAALYHTFLRRSAVFSNPADAGGWVTQLTNGTPFTTVSTSISRSAEALGLVVDGLYESILGRDADTGGRATHLNLIVNGATVEQIQSAFLASAEYTLRFGSNVAFVGSLYQTLLGRIPSQAEVDSQVALLPALGRQGLATGFLASTEYRNREVTALYVDILKRTTPPTAGEVATNVNTGLDLLALRVAFAGSAEFFANG